MIQSLEIVNVRSYDKCRIEFDSGTTLLIGDIGCGKSTILMAIEFALFGKGGGKLDSLLAKGKQAGSVKLEFETGGHAYEVFRPLKESRGSIGQDAKNSWISTDGVRDETLGIGEMKQKIIEILGTDEPSGTSAETSIFRYAVYTPQEDMKAVLSDPKKRTDTIRRAFKIDGFATAKDNSRKVVSDIRQRMGQYAVRFEDVASLEEKLSSHQARISDLKDSMESLNADAADAGWKVRSFESERAKAGKGLAAMNKVSGDICVMESKIEDLLQGAKESAEELGHNGRSIESLKDMLSKGVVAKPAHSMTVRKIDVELTRLRPKCDELIRVDSKIKSLEEDVSSLKKEHAIGNVDASKQREIVDGMSVELEKARSSMEETASRSGAISGEIRMLQENAHTLESGKECPLCQQGLDGDCGKVAAKSAGTRVTSLQKDLDKTNKSMAKIERDIPRIEGELEDEKNVLRACEEIISKSEEIATLSETSESLGQSRTRSDELETMRTGAAEYEDAMSERKEAEGRLATLEGQAEKITKAIEAAKAKIGSLEVRLAAKKAELDEFSGLTDTVSTIESNLEQWRQKETETRELLAGARTDLKNAQDAMAECVEMIADRKSWKYKHSSLGRHKDWMEKIFVPSVHIMEERSLEFVRARFNRLYGEFYSMLLDDPTKESSIDAEFTPVVTESGHDQSVYNLSGGEKTSIALAYRLTLAKMVREDSGMEAGLLMLDEPTDGFSKSQLEKVRIVLDEAGATQVILVSHDAELESHADRICRVSKSGGKSKIDEQ